MGWTEFSRSEKGAAGAWSLFIFMVCAVAAGVSIDGTNGMRAKEHLRSTAEVGAVRIGNVEKKGRHEDRAERAGNRGPPDPRPPGRRPRCRADGRD